MSAIDITGQKFGRLLVVERAGTKNRRAMWKCVCDCGNETIATGKSLRSGGKQSCGCLLDEARKRIKNNLVGMKFNRLTVEKLKCVKNHRVYWECRCDCGNIATVESNHLITGHTKSCGCLNYENKISHGLSNHRLYSTWKGMIERCENPNAISFKYYGQRGISVCTRWHDVKCFIYDMYPSFKEGLTLDRINNNGNYEPSNCRWASVADQNKNRRI